MLTIEFYNTRYGLGSILKHDLLFKCEFSNNDIKYAKGQHAEYLETNIASAIETKGVMETIQRICNYDEDNLLYDIGQYSLTPMTYEVKIPMVQGYYSEGGDQQYIVVDVMEAIRKNHMDEVRRIVNENKSVLAKDCAENLVQHIVSTITRTIFPCDKHKLEIVVDVDFADCEVNDYQEVGSLDDCCNLGVVFRYEDNEQSQKEEPSKEEEIHKLMEELEVIVGRIDYTADDFRSTYNKLKELTGYKSQL